MFPSRFLYSTVTPTMKFLGSLLLCISLTGRFAGAESSSCDVGEPLFLTPYIESGNIGEGQRAAYVNSRTWTSAEVESFAGYLTVNKTFNSNLYFWFFPAETRADNAPIVVWLQGGPGSSSLFGLFEEHGPFYFDLDETIKTRYYRWSKVFNIIYIDNPVGTGFSFTESDEGYARDEQRVGKELLSALSQFLQLFPHLKNNAVYITGESYGGKYVPALAYAIHRRNRRNKSKINLKGIAIGNGLIEFETMVNYADHLFQVGLIDENARLKFQQIQNETIHLISKKHFEEASKNIKLLMLNGGNTNPHSLFYNITGFSNFYNFLYDTEPKKYGNMDILIQRSCIRRDIHVGNNTFHDDSTEVADFLLEDLAKSVRPWFTVLLENYSVLLYSGQLDLIVPYSFTVSFLESLEWSGSEEYRRAGRKIWRVGNELAGFSKTSKSLTEVLVRNAGHMVPSDQPRWAFDLITRFVFNKPF